MTAPERMDRAAFDALVQRHVMALTSDPRLRNRPADRKTAQDEAQLLEAAAREFADAVDRSGVDVPYEEAVVVTGGAGPIVVTEEEWKATPAYWEAAAAGGTGRVDTLTRGPGLLRRLRGSPAS